MIASSKGRGFFIWFIYGALLFIVALVHVLLIKPTREKQLQGKKECNHCKELIHHEATVCPHCQRDVVA